MRSGASCSPRIARCRAAAPPPPLAPPPPHSLGPDTRLAGPFLEPVAWEELQLKDYPKVIKHPMDLGSVQARLKLGTSPGGYSHPKECVSRAARRAQPRSSCLLARSRARVRPPPPPLPPLALARAGSSTT